MCTHDELLTLLSRLADESHVSNEIGEHVRAHIHVLGPPSTRTGKASIWRMCVEGVYGEQATCNVTIPHDVYQPISVELVLSEGRHVDESGEFNQLTLEDVPLHDEPQPDRTGGKAIAMRLLERIPRGCF